MQACTRHCSIRHTLNSLNISIAAVSFRKSARLCVVGNIRDVKVC
jgi:hypothetical protein